MLEVPCKNVDLVVNEVLPTCMVKQCPIYPTHVDGTPINDADAPYFLGIDTEVCRAWGEKPTAEYARKYGLDLKYVA